MVLLWWGRKLARAGQDAARHTALRRTPTTLIPGLQSQGPRGLNRSAVADFSHGIESNYQPPPWCSGQLSLLTLAAQT